MPWLSRNNFTPTDKLHADDLNNLANDDRTWGGNVNGGGYTLSNVTIIEAGARTTGQVSSVFARIGDVVAMAGDYTAAQVGAVPIARQVIAGPGLTGGGPLSTDVTLTAAVQSFGSPPRTGAIILTAADITTAGGVLNTRQIKTLAGSGLSGGGALSADLSLSVLPDTTNQQVQVMSQGSPIGSPRHAINFISGTGALITVSEISASNRIDVTVASTGTGGGMVDPTQVVGDLIVRGLTAPATRMPVGTDGQVLTADHLQALGVKWATPANVGQVTSVFTRTGAVTAVVGDYSAAQITNAVDQTGSYVNPPWITSLPWSKITNPPLFMLDPTVAKGDLIVHGATTTRLPAGADGSVLTADSTLAAGVKWGSVPIISFNTRGGAVLPLAGDYTVAQVTGAVAATLTINTGTGLQGGGNLSSNRTFAVVPDTTNQQIQVLLAGAVVGTRHAINFVNGANVSLSISDNVGSNQIDLTVSSTGGGGGMVDPTTGIGDIIVRGATAVQRLGVGLNGQVLTCDNTQALGIRWAVPTGGGGSGSQTPWTGNVDAANFNLNNAGGIGVNIASNKTVARVYAFINASEDGFRAVTNSAAGMAAASFINDLGDSISIRSYGSGFVGGLPGLATLEASKPLALLANAAEVMRLTTGRVLIGTTTDDAVNMLQVNGKVKSKVGGFVFPDSTIQTTAYTSASSPVTSVFTRTGAVVQVVGDYSAAQVTNAVDSSSTYSNPSWISSLAWSKITGAPALLVDPTTTKGDLIARGTAGPATRLAVSATNGWVLTADSAQALGVKWAATPAQTPWTSNIDGGTFTLFNVGKLGVGVTVPYSWLHVRAGASSVSSAVNTDTVAFLEHSSNAYLEVVAGAGKQAGVVLGANAQTNAAQLMNLWDGTNHNLALNANIAGSYITLTTAGTEKMRITATGNVGIGVTPTAKLHIRGANGTSGLSPQSYTTVFFENGSTTYLELAANASPGPPNVGIVWSSGTAQTSYIIDYNGAVNWVAMGASRPIAIYTNAVERMRITAAGNVGIGNTNPSWPLTVTGAVRVQSDANALAGNLGLAQFAISGATDGNKNIWIGFDTTANLGVIQPGVIGLSWNSLVLNPSGGNVGIGTQAGPISLLHLLKTVNAGIGSTISLDNQGGGAGTGSSIDFAATSMGQPVCARIQAADNGDYSHNIIFLTRTPGGPTLGINERMRITSGGNVGIGTLASAFERFHVIGNIAVGSGAGNTSYYKFSVAGDQTSMQIGYWVGGAWYGSGGIQVAFGGQVGIGKAPVGFALDVAGSVNVTGTYLRNGAPICQINTQYNQTPVRALNTVYQNTTSVPMFVSVYAIVNSGSYIKLLADAGNPPTFTVFASTNTYSNTAGYSASGWVMPGHYYKADTPGATLTTWTEWF